jgi:hypothetical protein
MEAAMLQFLIRALGVIGTPIGAFGLLLPFENVAIWKVAALCVLACFSFCVVLVDLLVLLRNWPHKYDPNSPLIKNYMRDWLGKGGRAAIFTRDMSWAEPGSQVTKLLEEKATRRELLLFVAHTPPVVETLRAKGADVYVYPKQFTPKSRFTIIDYEKNGARIAIGVVEGRKHVIREFSVSHSPMSPILEDLNERAQIGS